MFKILEPLVSRNSAMKCHELSWTGPCFKQANLQGSSTIVSFPGVSVSPKKGPLSKEI